jgi:uncharacterized protein (DUF1697 family)
MLRMTAYLALLRAVNVGGKSKLPMKELRDAMQAAGFANVATYIQSGNVLFDAPDADRDALPGRLAALIEREFGVRSPVVLRTRDELAQAIANYPFAGDGTPAKLLHIMFLADLPAPANVAALDPNRSPGDDYVVIGRDVHIRFGAGVAGSKLTNAYFDAKLGTVGTARNLRTANTLLEMIDNR